jgi:hypothetical protein
MLPIAERRSFIAHDADGRRYLLVATRPDSETTIADGTPIWAYRTLDGRAVRRGTGCNLYTVEPGDIRLTTSDLAEPAR